MSDTTTVHGPTERLVDVQEALEQAGWSIRSATNGGPIGHLEIEGVGHEWVEYVTEQWGFYRNPDLDGREWV